MKPIIILLIACAAAMASPAPSTSPAASTQPASGTRYAYRNVRILWHGTPQPNSSDFDETVRRTTARIASTALGSTPDSPDWLQLNSTVRQEGYDLFLLANLPGDARPAAKEFLDQALKAIQKSAEEDFDRRRTEALRPRQEAAEIAEMRVRDAEARAAHLRAEMRKLAGRADISGKTITEAMTRLEEEKQKIELDLMAKTARREAMEQEIAEQGKRMQEKIGTDPIAEELAKVVDAQEKKLDQIRKLTGSGQASASEMNDAIAAVATARAKLLERRRDAAAEAGGDALSSMNRELLTLSVDLRELKARLGYVESHLPGLRDAMDQLDAWERTEAELQNARTELAGATDSLRTEERNQSRMRAPTFEVLDTADREQPPKPPGQNQ